MKHIILVLVLITSVSFSQNWTGVIDTDVDVSSAVIPVDIFANGVGLHIIYTENNALKYCKMDVEGNQYPGSPVTLESSSVVWPSITGDATKIYVVYRKSSETYIRTKYSTDGGTNWNYLATNPSNSNASFIESVYSEDKLHVTYQVSSSVYYSRYISSWSTPYTVSNTENGSLPRIVAWNGNNEDKVYFYYRNTSSVCKWREYNVTSNSWGSIQNAFNVSNSEPSGFAADGSNIALYYTYYNAPMYYFQWVVRQKSNNSVLCTRTAEPSASQIIYSTTTSNNQMHAAFWFNWYAEEEDPGIYRSKGDDNCTIDEIYTHNYQEQQNVHFINTSASSNDVYVIWQDDYIGDDLRLIYDDQNPLAPQNLAVEVYTVENKTYPKLTWSLNNEPDVFIKTNAYEVWRRTKFWSGPWSSWSLIGYKNGNQTEYIDYTISGLYVESYTAEYKIKAKDVGNNISSYSSTVSINFSTFNKLSQDIEKYEYALDQNYPNPFNPTTQISYSLAKNAFVTLRVYDILGKEVAELVNGGQIAGFYEISFDASELSSGIYIYRVTAINDERILFSESKQMILLK
ncbi:MAG: hypothetical protein DRQ13_07685 [Ignavibacteriae bacterium]|nr:MAG: hypothetical protein DRQ13_07685 [Ignavibacteriota bacterium]